MMRYGPGVALIVVDMQNDFASPKGSLTVAGGEAIVPIVNGQVGMARSNKALVVFTQDWHPPHTPHFARDGGTWPVHCVADTWGAEFHEGILCPPGTPLIRKGTNGEDGYSAFTMRDPQTGATVPTPLETLLYEAGVDNVVVVGLATDYCVKATALDAIRLGHHTTVLTDAIAAVNVNAGDGDAALGELEAAGVALASSLMR
jgi:nicotinamidase/pyrazinamidase